MKLLAEAKALHYLAGPKFLGDVYAEVSDQFSGLGGSDLDRLVQNSRPTPKLALDNDSHDPGSFDAMPFDSDGGAVLPFQRKLVQSPGSTSGDDE